jgi:hypothetical protein
MKYVDADLPLNAPARMSDEEFATAFEACAIPNDLFRHRDHLRLAWIYLRRCGPSLAAARISDAIRKYAVHNGAPEKYHETVTLAWLRLVESAIKCAPEKASFEEILAICPELLEKATLRKYYSSALLASKAARISLIEPDLAPLP